MQLPDLPTRDVFGRCSRASTLGHILHHLPYHQEVLFAWPTEFVHVKMRLGERILLDPLRQIETAGSLINHKCLDYR
jgi:hypothetical protein